MPEARIAMITSPGPGVGSGNSSSATVWSPTKTSPCMAGSVALHWIAGTQMVSQPELDVDVRDVVYQRPAGEPLLARVYQPRGPGPFPVMLDVHGGAWTRNDRTGNESIDLLLAGAGFVVAAIDFRMPPDH